MREEGGVGEQPERVVYHSSPPSTAVISEWTRTSLPSHGIKMDNVTFKLTHIVIVPRC